MLNRRGLETELSARLAPRPGGADTLSALLIDIDHFKRVNDDFGHATGDRVLVRVADLLASRIRAGDAAGRHGGEEFLVLLGGCRLADAGAIAESLRQGIAEHDFELARALTVSVGVAERAPGETAETMLDRADRALYEAKAAGRNRVVLAPPPARASGSPG